MTTRPVAVRIAAALLCALPAAAGATNGYFQHGYGLRAKGMGGAATAMTADAFGGANNPATMVWVGNRIDFGVDLFSPRRSAVRTGSGPAGIDGSVESDSTYFAIPEFGYNRMIRPDLSLGVTVYANGGMNTDFPGGQIPPASACAAFNPAPGPYNLLCGNGQLGVDLMQLFVAPTLSYKLGGSHSIGIAPLFAYQRFAAEGLQAFGGFSTNPAAFTNRGHDSATGWGVRVGWLGRFGDAVSVGAAYASRTRMSAFDRYKGLFAEGGDFDVPANWNIGIAVRPTSRLTLAFDYQRIEYSGVKAVANPSSLLLQCAGGNPAACLGGANGAGFGWKDVDVWKIGVEYALNDRWTLRGGYHRSDNPIGPADVTFNILAPGVMQEQLSLGFTYRTRSGGELSVAYLHAFENSVTAGSLFRSFGAPATTTERIRMHQNALGIAYGWKM